MASTLPAPEESPAITVRFPDVTPPPAVLVGAPVSVRGPQRSPAALSLPFPQTRTAPMAERAPAPTDIVCFAGEKLALLDDFVRLQMASRRVTFLSVLDRQGLTPQYYTLMVRRLDALLDEVPALRAEYDRRLAQALAARAA